MNKSSLRDLLFYRRVLAPYLEAYLIMSGWMANLLRNESAEKLFTSIAYFCFLNFF